MVWFNENIMLMITTDVMEDGRFCTAKRAGRTILMSASLRTSHNILWRCSTLAIPGVAIARLGNLLTLGCYWHLDCFLLAEISRQVFYLKKHNFHWFGFCVRISIRIIWNAGQHVFSVDMVEGKFSAWLLQLRPCCRVSNLGLCCRCFWNISTT